MQNVRVLSNHKRALLSHKCTFREKIARFNISQFYVNKINHWVSTNDYWQNWIYTKIIVFRHLTIITVSKYYRFHDKNFLGNHKCTASHYMINLLTHWDRDKMADIFQTIFSNVFSSIKMFEFRLRFHWNLFLRFELTISQHGFR